MNYPVWDVPIIGLPWVIGIIAIIHIPISHFAVGGGFYLPMAEAKAEREGREDWLRVLRDHSRFFLILTGVAGALTGVGIWFAIGLCNPEGTSTLIHNFVFAWAIEWVFFLVELVAIAVYYYGWGRMPRRLHTAVGWVYGISAYLSLVIINGILTFMLTPGDAWLSVAGTGQESSRFWQAFLNPTYWPSLALRTLVCCALAGAFALIAAGRLDGERQAELKESLARWSVLWVVPAFALMPLCLLWYLVRVPEAQRELLSLGVSSIAAGQFTHVTRSVVIAVASSMAVWLFLYLTAWRNPREVSVWHAVGVLCLCVMATGSTEYARETLRKPYVVVGYLYSNGIRPNGDTERLNREGYLTHTVWATPEEREEWTHGTGDQVLRGEMVFRGQCASCHTLDGYRPMRKLLAGRDRESVASIVDTLRHPTEESPYWRYMPPPVGTDDEIEALVTYLALLNPASETIEAATDPESAAISEG